MGTEFPSLSGGIKVCSFVPFSVACLRWTDFHFTFTWWVRKRRGVENRSANANALINALSIHSNLPVSTFLRPGAWNEAIFYRQLPPPPPLQFIHSHIAIFFTFNPKRFAITWCYFCFRVTMNAGYTINRTKAGPGNGFTLCHILSYSTPLFRGPKTGCVRVRLLASHVAPLRNICEACDKKAHKDSGWLERNNSSRSHPVGQRTAISLLKDDAYAKYKKNQNERRITILCPWTID